MAMGYYGVDMGTSNIKIYNSLNKTILNEKNIVAIKPKLGLYDFGDSAFEMYEKTPDTIQALFPIQNGVIADVKSMRSSFEQFFIKLNKPKTVKGGKFCIAVPTDITEIEKHAFVQVISDSNIRAKDLKVVEKPVADAIGVGIDVNSPKGNMIVNIGADTTEISVISLGGIVVSKILKNGGNKFDEAIAQMVKRRYNLLIGLKTAEKIKIELSDAIPEEIDDEYPSMDVYGRNIITGLPSCRPISSDVVYKAISDNITYIVDSVKLLLERTPPELSADIVETGIYLTGGSSAIKNLDLLIANETGLKVNTVHEPGESVIRGITKIVSDTKYKNLMYVPRQNNY